MRQQHFSFRLKVVQIISAMPVKDTFQYADRWDSVGLDCSDCQHFRGPENGPTLTESRGVSFTIFRLTWNFKRTVTSLGNGSVGILQTPARLFLPLLHIFI